MQKVYKEVGTLDKKAYEDFCLSEDLLMENAGLALKSKILKIAKKKHNILIVCGKGNNGADGLALARLLQGCFARVDIYIPFGLSSKMAFLQEKRAKLLACNFVSDLKTCKYNVVVDCIFGSGLNKPLDEKYLELIKKLNLMIGAKKIACDVPSGIDEKGHLNKEVFKTDFTVSMGAYKMSQFCDNAKDFVGKLELGFLGLCADKYMSEETKIFLLEKKDLSLPCRKTKNTNKGSFGHSCFVLGEKKGACILSANASFAFGSGLVSVLALDLDKENAKNAKNADNAQSTLPLELMSVEKVPKNTTALALGMGLGEYPKDRLEKLLKLEIKKVFDADLFYKKEIIDFFDDDNLVLTPHPKEFASLLKLTNLADIGAEELQDNRFFYLEKFSKKYPKLCILLKGANTLIAKNNIIYINTLGSAVLSKGGSGDVLAGMIASLLAQGQDNLSACINASLAHTLAGKNFKKNSYALSPEDLIKGIKVL